MAMTRYRKCNKCSFENSPAFTVCDNCGSSLFDCQLIDLEKTPGWPFNLDSGCKDLKGLEGVEIKFKFLESEDFRLFLTFLIAKRFHDKNFGLERVAGFLNYVQDEIDTIAKEYFEAGRETVSDAYELPWWMKHETIEDYEASKK